MPAEPTIDESRFKVEFLSPEDYDEVHRLQVDIFTEQNVVNRQSRISKWVWGEFSAELCRGWEKVGLTQIVRDREADGAVVAFLFCKESDPLDFSLPNFEALREDSPGIGFLLQHATQCLTPAMSVPRLGPTLAVEVGGTKAGYEGKGLATYLRWRLCRLAKERGFFRMTVETQSMAARHIYHDLLGFEIYAESKFVDWQAPDGTYPYRDEFILPEDEIFNGMQKVLRDKLDLEGLPCLRVSGAGSEEVNGVYVRVPGSRGYPGSTHDAWEHSSRPGYFLANMDGDAAGHPEWGKRWTLYWPKGPCYAKSDSNDDVPPEGEWEEAPWVSLAKLGTPGEGPAPRIEHCGAFSEEVLAGGS